MPDIVKQGRENMSLGRPKLSCEGRCLKGVFELRDAFTDVIVSRLGESIKEPVKLGLLCDKNSF